MKKFSLNDVVIITAGKDKGKKGKITRVFPRLDQVVVEGVGSYKKHLKPFQTKGKGEIVDKQRPIHTASIAHLDAKDGKPTRAKFLIDKSGVKQRISARTQSLLSVHKKEK